MICNKCQSDCIARVSAKCSDLCAVQYKGIEHIGYVPDDLGIGGGDYVDFSFCLSCGKIQGIFPLGDHPSFFYEEGGEEEEEEEGITLPIE